MGPVQQLASPGVSDRLQAITTSGKGGLVGCDPCDGRPGPAAARRPVGLDGAPKGAAQSVLAVAGAASLAQGLSRAAAIGSDGQSCQLVPLNGDGTTAGAATSLGMAAASRSR